MEAHHGFIDLESAPGKGTTFSLFFPLSDAVAIPERIHLVAPMHLVGKVADSQMAENYVV